MANDSRGRPEVETKRDAFLRLAEKRTNAVLERLRILSNCANQYAYDYEEDDVERIFAAIHRELRVTRARFVRSANRGQFRLRDESEK